MPDVELFAAKLRRKALFYLEPWWLKGDLARLEEASQGGTASVVDPSSPVVVSLTTHGERLNSVHLTLESIGRGALKPRMLILWLDNPAVMDRLPEPVRRLMARGLEVRLTENYGPHTKYFPYVMSEEDHRVALVTADDDIIYPVGWLHRLVTEGQRTPGMVVCYRAHEMALDTSGRPKPYNTWMPCESKEARPINFATGVSGVLYPPAYLNFARAQKDAFRAVCPRADDIWLHVLALRGGFAVRQLGRLPRHFPVIPNTQHLGLVNSNFFANGNDPQIAATYTEADLSKLRHAGAPN
ncbi:MAG TPA: hypothetical protein VIN58_09605 [Roseateles sp.]